MNSNTFGNYQWSRFYSLGEDDGKENVPKRPGIYEIYADFEFGRLIGRSQIISIGKAKNLYERLCKGRFGDIVKNLDRPEKWLFNAKHNLKFHCIETDSEEEAKWLEALRQWEYENKHWELPPGNDKLEKAAIFNRIKQKYGEIDERSLKTLLEKHNSAEKVASILGVPTFVITNLWVYWMV